MPEWTKGTDCKSVWRKPVVGSNPTAAFFICLSVRVYAMPLAPAATDASPRPAPPGFTTEQWETFLGDGFLAVEDALSPDECGRYIDAIDRCARDRGKDPEKPGEYWGPQNVVEWDPVFTELIDHPRHIGFAYDIYGELTKLHHSQFMLRPRGGWHNLWHPDGPRALPYNVFSPVLPLQLKIAYWLTDLPEPKMGNFVYMPGSHHEQVQPFYDTHESVPGERIVCCRAGTMTLLHNATWHRVEANESPRVRKNIFYTYSPSWICNQDHWHSDPGWLATLTREQRILMRSYEHAYDWAKPAPDQFPLYLDRDTGSDRDEGVYPPHVELHRRKRLTMHEKRTQHAGTSGEPA
jgi:hypothetical protein